ncbi:methylated-DNA--protein-cysteine methyltransferase [Sporobolomyces salmoneus]|uniref:methylated-DNA--protein-cysteine methyltransferase n=1 Tax=Sporobolomyces salmoneus TaxID=183962 RepID=UPI00317D786F
MSRPESLVTVDKEAYIDQTRGGAVSEATVEVIVLEDTLSETDPSPTIESSPPYPQTLTERSKYVREPKDGKKGTKVTAFQWRLYDLLLQVPPGKVSTYGQLSSILSSSPRAVGSALRNNPFAPFVPCHRIIATNGYIGGFSGEWNKKPSSKKWSNVSRGKADTIEQGPKVSQKLQLLLGEGVKFDAKGFLKDKTCWWKGV